MKQRVTDYIADFLAMRGITDIFTVTGGGAMHLNDAFGHHGALRCIYNHHEQACAIAAEGYTRSSGKLAAVCVTTGPGGTNALTGVLGGYLDSIPMIVISGQVKYSTTIKSTRVPLRQLGDQEFNITDCVKTMTKFAEMIVNPLDIGYLLEKCLFIATHGRPGPVWLDVPLNVQGAVVETEQLRHYNQNENREEIPSAVTENKIREILQRIETAKRPVVLAGTGVRLSGAYEDFIELIEKLNVPVVTELNAPDILWCDHAVYCGHAGSVGNRGGNFVVQNSDLLFILGCRLNLRQVSFNWENFAPNAYKIMVDIDPCELLKPTLSIDYPVYADVKDIIRQLNVNINEPLNLHGAWLERSRNINKRYPTCLPEYYRKESPINPYVFINELFAQFEEHETIITANGSAYVCTFQSDVVKKGQRLFTNSGCASMGYGLPAAIGAAVEKRGERVICLEGDGSIQMNLQELQTVAHNNLNIKIFVFNNNGYHSIKQTQTNLFKPPLCGVSPDSGISFPEMERIAKAYKIPFIKIEKISQIKEKVAEALNVKGAVLVEAVLDPQQFFEPKLSAKLLSDGSMISPPLEDMYPFLSDENIKHIREELTGDGEL
ncbi:MAG: thiamine pyrophosphate-binding protein [Treponema sp.]|jgi:acetolactate synthase-1/2/3 large subunit|nr:thiamine pyrophosphate-binding protein [Treponema sp.]